MYRNFQEVMSKAKNRGTVTVCVAAAHDKDVLKAVIEATGQGLARAILVGRAGIIESYLSEMSVKHDFLIIDEPDERQAAQKAVKLVKEGQARVLMKGLINSSDFMRAVLASDTGLTAGKRLSHLGAFEVPGQKKIIFFTDGGVNVAPSLLQKKDILIDALCALEKIGILNPKVALLSINEKVSPKIPSAVDAKALADMRRAGVIPTGILEGPIAMDVAVSPEAARHKGIKSNISGDVDLFLVPNADAGNMIGKTLIHYAGAKMAGLILGAASPIVMTSRAETAEGKLYSVALACLMC